MTWLIARFGPTLGKILFWIAVVILLVAVGAVAKCTYDQKAATVLKVEQKQGDAKTKSAVDAIDTAGNRAAIEANGAEQVQETRDAINNATDVRGVTNAGRAGLCRQADRHC